MALLVFLVGFGNLSAQNIKTLEAKKSKIKENIKLRKQILQETQKSKKLTATQIAIIEQKIRLREELIETYSQEVELINSQIQETSSVIVSMEDDLKVLKEEYARMIRAAYRNRDANRSLMYIFASEDFTRAYRRMKYLQQYTAYRQRQASMIELTREELGSKREELEGIKLEKLALLEGQQTEKNALASEQKEQRRVVSKLEQKEVEVKAYIAKQQAEQKTIAAAIKKMMEDAKNASSGGAALSGSFKKNKRKLPFPVKSGIITGKYGRTYHEKLGIQTDNNGIDISCTKGTKASVVFDGVVSSVVIIPNAGKMVMVRHGSDFFTIYANLSDVYVKKGDKVKTRQEIGLVLTNSETNKTEMHFELWQSGKHVNPTSWVRKSK